MIKIFHIWGEGQGIKKNTPYLSVSVVATSHMAVKHLKYDWGDWGTKFYFI